MIKRLEDKTKNIGIKKIMKKNQVVILALALMLMTAGYLNYTNNHENENLLLAGLGDAQLVSANVTHGSVNEDNVSSNIVDTNNVDQSQTIENNSNEQNVLNEDIETNANNDILNIDLSDFKPGTYFFIITTDKGTCSEKVIVG